MYFLLNESGPASHGKIERNPRKSFLGFPGLLACFFPQTNVSACFIFFLASVRGANCSPVGSAQQYQGSSMYGIVIRPASSAGLPAIACASGNLFPGFAGANGPTLLSPATT